MGSSIWNTLPPSLQWAIYYNPIDTMLFFVFLGLAIVHHFYFFTAIRQGDWGKRRHYAWLGWADLVLVIGGMMGVFSWVPLNLGVDVVGLTLLLIAPKQHQPAV